MKRMLFGVLFAALAASAATAGSLNGTVRDRTTSLPIPDAVVTVHVLLPDSVAFPDTSDASGVYAIDGIVSGNQIYVVMAWKAGYRSYYFRHDAIGSGSYDLDIVLEPETFPPGGTGDSSQVSGQVLGRTGLSGPLVPIVGADVAFVSGANTYSVTTGPAGYYSRTVPQGGYAVTASATGYLPRGSSGVAVGPAGLTYGTILSTSVTGVAGDVKAPGQFELLDAYPNPFNPTTEIRYQVSGASNVKLVVYNILGREVATLVNESKAPGTYAVRFNAAGLPSGIYIYQLTSGSFVQAKKIVLMK